MIRSALRFPTVMLLTCALVVEGAWGGFNEDGFVDLFFTTEGSAEICLGDGNGGFSCSYTDAGFFNDADDVDVGDINRDGHIDVVLAYSLIGRGNQWCAGDGNGGFSCHDFPGDERSNASKALSVGDVDRDHNLDVVFANQGQDRICFGDGSGNFECSNISEQVYGGGDVDLADFNGDGYLDAVFANSGSPETICLWNKVDEFECLEMTDDSKNSYFVSTEDMNGDGAIDIVFANRAPDVHQLCLGDNSGSFTCNSLGTDATKIGGVGLGDVNNDGHKDAVFANIGQRNRVCLGDGNGNFACSDVSPEEAWTTGVALADVNEDGRLEAVFANQGPAANKICSWDGVSAFACTVISGYIPGGQHVIAAPGTTGVPSIINAGLNDAWFNPATAGQGFFITVFADIKMVFLAWFTYDTERPDPAVIANLGEPGHRWLTAFGPYSGNTAELEIEITSGGVFDSVLPAVTQKQDGTITLEFSDCENGLVSFNIESLNLQGEVPIERIANDNVSICEALNTQ